MTHDEMIDVIMHHKNGGEVEYYAGEDVGWIYSDYPVWNFAECKYRAKPEPMTIFAEVSNLSGRIMIVTTQPTPKQYDKTTIKKFIESP